MNDLQSIRSHIAADRLRLAQHPLYTRMSSLEDIRLFMESHVFAVWDFMALLKRLQRDLTCIDIPWIPKGDAEVRFLINEIVCGEESDVDPAGSRISHFELYLRAMHEAGANTLPILQSVERATRRAHIETSLASAPTAAASFSKATFDLALGGQTHEVAAAFTFGREDLIPDLFRGLVDRLSREHPGRLDTFRYYLERHIEVDGGHHGAIALRMVECLCGSDPQRWQEATAAASAAIQARLALWDAIAAQTNPAQTNPSA